MADTESRINDSILNDIRTAAGLESDNDAFDTDLVIHINSLFNFLTQCGVGPEEGFSISGDSENWSDFISDERQNMVKSYMLLKTRLLFDPPTSSFVLTAWKEEVAEMEWRLKEEVEEGIFH